MSSSNTLTLTGLNTLSGLGFSNSGTITGGSIALASGATFINASPGQSTLASPLNFTGASTNYWSNAGGSGTLNIAAPIADTVGHLYLHDGNYTMGSAGSITVSGFALVMSGSSGTEGGAHTTNFLQTSGVISASRPSSPAATFYVSQAGTGSLTMTGGSLLVTSGTGSVGDNRTVATGTFTINGAGAVASFAGLDLTGNGAGVATVNLQNGALRVNYLFTDGATSSTAYDIFNFSGGTLQPLNSGVASAGWGSATAAQNITLAISGSAATMSSSDTNGVGRTVPAYVTLAGSGTLSTAGAGTIVMQGSNSGFNGVLNVAAGTVQIGAAGINALGNANAAVLINGGALDINGITSSNPSPPITLAAGSIVDSTGVGVLNAPSYTLQSGTVSAVLGGGGSPLHKTTSGLVLLTVANTYNGATIVNAGTLALGAIGTLPNGNVTVSQGAVLDTSAWDPVGGYSFSNMTLTAGRTSSFAADINGSVNMSNATISPAASGTMTISGSLNLNGNVTYSYAPGSKIAVGGALSLSYPEYLLPTTPLSAGTYTLITYNAGTPDPASDFAMGGSYQGSTRQTYSFGTSGGSAVALVVSGSVGNLFWNSGNSTWDIQSTPAWYNSTTGSADVSILATA